MQEWLDSLWYDFVVATSHGAYKSDRWTVWLVVGGMMLIVFILIYKKLKGRKDERTLRMRR